MEEALYMEIMLEGVISIQKGEHPSIVKEKLQAFLSPAMRDETQSPVIRTNYPPRDLKLRGSQTKCRYATKVLDIVQFSDQSHGAKLHLGCILTQSISGDSREHGQGCYSQAQK
eukprot:TRINITY_DN140471_c0_g1_i1.p2 TRINITY_DN140471_c0_g1~~TRINITY_DN140471_c0_g1_i1.p2  ORF type:complete len:126 (-),score=4.17 TRINITY_DN140471_c0_g1_i1:34-375(-)